MHITMQRNFARNMRTSMTGAERIVLGVLGTLPFSWLPNRARQRFRPPTDHSPWHPPPLGRAPHTSHQILGTLPFFSLSHRAHQ